MKRSLFLSLLLVSFGARAQVISSPPAIPGRTVSFDDNWLFKKDSTINADAANYSDVNWRKIDLPHDWSIEDLPNQIQDRQPQGCVGDLRHFLQIQSSDVARVEQWLVGRQFLWFQTAVRK